MKMNDIKTRLLSEIEREYWDREMQKFDMVHPLNAFGWGMVRSADGWKPTYLVAERNGLFCGGMMVLERKIPFTPYSILYSPKGPVWDYSDDPTLTALIDAIKNLAKEKNSIFIRIDPDLEQSFVNHEGDKFEGKGFIHLKQRWSYWNSPRDVSRINLLKHQNSDDYLKKLKYNTRSSIRKATKNEISVEPTKDKTNLKIFYDIFRDFALEKGFMARDYPYQEKLWDEFIERGLGSLLLIRYQGEIIGGSLNIMFGKKCLGMHLAVPYKYQKMGASYASVWTAIKWAKEEGCVWFSWRGVGATPSQEYFKKQFVQDIKNLVGYYDYPFKKVLYRLFYLCEFKVLPKIVPIIISGKKQLQYIKKILKLQK